MANYIALTVVKKLMYSLVFKLIQEIRSELQGYKSECEELQNYITAIKSKIQNDTQMGIRDLSSEEGKSCVSHLKNALNDAEHLLDEFFITLAKHEECDGGKCGKFFKKRPLFFSEMSRRLKETKQQLDRILIDYERIPFFERKPDLDKTCSYVDVENIIGRDADKKVILDVLLDPRVSEQFCYLTIVGLGGLGKTALAQLLLNDEKIRDEFLLLWICVSDKDGEDFDVKIILCEILESLIQKNVDSMSCTMEDVHDQFEKQFRGKKYFLVLDDVWNEDFRKWIKLEKYFKDGSKRKQDCGNHSFKKDSQYNRK